MDILRSLPRLSLPLSPHTLPAAHASLGFCSMQPRYRECDGASNLPLSRPPFLFPEVSRVSEEDGSAIKQLAVKVTDRRSRRVPLPIGRLTLFWNSMGRTFLALRSPFIHSTRRRSPPSNSVGSSLMRWSSRGPSANHDWNSWLHGKLKTWTSSFRNEFMRQLEPGNDSISRTMQTGSHSWGVGTAAQATRGGGEGR